MNVIKDYLSKKIDKFMSVGKRIFFVIGGVIIAIGIFLNSFSIAEKLMMLNILVFVDGVYILKFIFVYSFISLLHFLIIFIGLIFLTEDL